MQGEDALAPLVARLDRLVARYDDPDSACAHEALYRIVRLEVLRGNMNRVIQRTEHLATGPVVSAFPNDDARVYYARTIALLNVGRNADAQRTISSAATLVPRLGVRQAVLILSQLAEMAKAQGEWAVAEATFGRAAQIVRDSAATRTDEQRAIVGRLMSKQAYFFLERLDAEPDPRDRARFAYRLLAAADSGLALIHASTPDDADMRTTNDGFTATLQIDAAFGEAVLGRHDRAARRLQAAYRLISPEVIAMLDFVEPDYWLRLSETALMAGNLDAAEDAARVARASSRKAFGVGRVSQAEEQTAIVLEAAGRWHEAEVHYREAARIADIDWESERLQDWGASQFAAQQRSYHGLTRMLLRQGDTAGAFAVLDGARARALRDLRTWQTVRVSLSPERRARVDSLLAVVQEQRVTLLADTLRPDQIGVIRGEIVSTQQQIERETDIRARPQAQLDMAAVRGTLRAQQRTLLSYLVGSDSTIVFVITADTLTARTLAIGRQELVLLMAEAGGAWTPGGPDPSMRLQPLEVLYDRLVRPIESLLAPDDGLVIIPDGPLADLPFGALLTGPIAASGPQPFLIRTRAVSTDLAAALIPEANLPEPHFDVDLLAFGRSRFDGGGGQFRSRSGARLANLPNVTAEIHDVEAHAGNPAAALNERATEARFVEQAGSARIVHIASHAEVDPSFPLNSKIFLWDDPDDDDDGVVHLFELQALSLPADLVVLSGCSTAAGEAKSGEGTIGLQYGVRAAGARAAVATLWPVDDAATGELVESFYTALGAGLPADRALQYAQVAYLDTHTGAEASPYFWAATVLSGSPSPVPLHGPRSLWPWMVGTLALGTGGLAWRARRRTTNA